MIANRPPIPAIYNDNGYIGLPDILQLTGISSQKWRYGIAADVLPQPAKRGGPDGDLWRVIDIRPLLCKSK